LLIKDYYGFSREASAGNFQSTCRLDVTFLSRGAVNKRCSVQFKNQFLKICEFVGLGNAAEKAIFEASLSVCRHSLESRRDDNGNDKIKPHILQ